MNNNISIIGVDFSEGEDESALAIRCGNCGEIIHMTTTPNKDKIDCKLFKRCPKCNIKFEKTLVYQ